MAQIPEASAAPASDRFAPYLPQRPFKAWDRTDGILALSLFILSLALYVAMLTPTITSTSFDTPELVTKSGLLAVAHTPGSPVYVWLGYLFSLLPFGELAVRVNMMSALSGATVVALLYLLVVRHLTGGRLSAVGSAALFGLSLTFWAQAVIAELYAPNMAFLGFAVLALLQWGAAVHSRHRDGGRRWLVVFALAFGLSLGIHLSNVLYLPAFGLFALLGWPTKRKGLDTDQLRHSRLSLQGRFSWRTVVIAATVGLLSFALPYTWVYFNLPNVPAGDLFPKTGLGWSIFYEDVFNAFSAYRFGFPLRELPDRVTLFLHLLSINVGLPGVALMLLGAWRLLFTRLRLFFLLLTMMTANLVFYVDYNVPDGDVFYIPAFWVAACLAGVGLEAGAVGVRTLARVRRRRSLGIQDGLPRIPPRAIVLPSLLLGAIVLVQLGADWQQNYTANNVSQDLSFRDFYRNAFPMIPQGAYYYHRGASLGYDLLYYTQLCGVRPDLHVQAGKAAGEPPPGNSPWPPGPVYSGVTSSDAWLPSFVLDPGDNTKWYQPLLTGMFRFEGGIQQGWLNLYKVRRVEDIPTDWLVAADSPLARPSRPLQIDYTRRFSLLGYDAEPRAERGKPWRLVRYWRTTSTFLPQMATVLGNHVAVEAHTPLFDQFEAYVKARGLTEPELKDYVIREEVNLVIPSNIPPGRYPVTVSTARPRLMSAILDPAPPGELLRREETLTTIDVVDSPSGPPPDPLAGSARCGP